MRLRRVPALREGMLKAGEGPSPSCHLWVSPRARRNSQRGQIQGFVTEVRMSPGTPCSGGRMGWAVGSEPPGPPQGSALTHPTPPSPLLALLPLTPLLYFTVTYSLRVSFIGSQKLFSVSASELSALPHPRPGGGSGLFWFVHSRPPAA